VAVLDVFAELQTEAGPLMVVIDASASLRLPFESCASYRDVRGVAVSSLDDDTLEPEGDGDREKSSDCEDNGVEGLPDRWC
jgi:hypothetical protein